MSRSYKKPIYKDGSGRQHQEWRRLVRRRTKHLMRNGIYDIPHRNGLNNHWDYNDWVTHFYYNNSWLYWTGEPYITKEDEKAARRK